MKPSANTRNNPGQSNQQKSPLSLKQKSFLISGGAHLALVASLLVSFEFAAKPVDLATGKRDTQAPVIIEARFIDSNVLEQNKREKQQAEAAAKRKQEAEAARKREQARKEQQRKEEAEKAKRRKAAEDKKRKEDAARKERELQEKAKQAAEQAKQDEAEKALQAKLKKEQEAREKMMQQQMAAEQAERNERRQREILSGMQIANSKIRARIEQNLIETGNLKGRSCRLQLKIAANGLVLDAFRVDGDEALCLALRSAALRARTLPMPEDPDINKQIRNSTLRWDN
ncbi:cell envelope integrity protein TolA [Glaciecola sp. MH2013]|uniref:cell envelope integrity protein TolA n=1 Tax=Glaciecola sp. MH2013 TaxID=2785524 RepID=UPI00189DEA00|nr:cell envelope integrity protein TolA [Glaciecola sp. MH2013]MBF7073228.1 cell envelope integrity protein TolA [Glaciecola sp. MH2013]